MAKTGRKIQRKLEARQNGYKEMCENAEARVAGSSKGYTCPGSRNPKKT